MLASGKGTAAQAHGLKHKSVPSLRVAPGRAPRRASVAVAAADKPRADARGYVAEDNSGRGNIFPNKQQAYMKRGGTVEGIGGSGGLGVIGGIVAVLAVLVVVVGRSGGPESLGDVAGTVGGDSLSAIAARLQKTL